MNSNILTFPSPAKSPSAVPATAKTAEVIRLADFRNSVRLRRTSFGVYFRSPNPGDSPFPTAA